MASAAPVAVGGALARFFIGSWDVDLLSNTFLAAFLIQVATNYFNDLVDAEKGADTSSRLGPVRAVASGVLSATEMKILGCVSLAGALFFAQPLIAAGGWPILVLGLVSIFLSYGYTGGPWPLAYRGLGEVFVILFFGIISVVGTFYIQTKFVNVASFVAGLQIGLLSAVLILINNMRDVAEDARSGKRTLSVRIGLQKSRVLLVFLCLSPYFIGLFWFQHRMNAFVFPLFGLGLSVVVLRGLMGLEPSYRYNQFLALAGLNLALFAALLTWGLSF